ncbi:MAG: hypothetical protein L3J93_01050 [Thermoplasmata archaeon]|nr:hypothetical protein [Thermoplasmata archaeon]
MTEHYVEVADAILRDHGIHYVVVGGQAVARTVQTGTSDVDVMVTTADFDATVAVLLKDKRIRLRGLREGVALFAIESAQGVGFDLLDAAPFGGTRTGEEFFRFLIDEESTETDRIRYSSTALVWYTRMHASRWRVYAEKILVNILDGADPKELERVEAIARRFGCEEALRPRIAYVREELRGRSGDQPSEAAAPPRSKDPARTREPGGPR